MLDTERVSRNTYIQKSKRKYYHMWKQNSLVPTQVQR